MPASDDTRQVAAPANLWPRISGPVLTAGAIILMELLASTPLEIPNPPAILLLIVVFSSFQGGLRFGLISAGIAWLYFAYFLSISGRPFHYSDENLRRLVVWALTTPGMALLVGILKSRADRTTAEILRREREYSATLAGALVERTRAEESLGARSRELLVLNRIAEISLSAQPLQTALQEIVEEIGVASGFPIVVVERCDWLKQTMRFDAAGGMRPSETPLEVPMDETLSGIVARTGQPLIEANAWARSEYANEILRQHGTRTFVCVPIMVSRRVIGTLSLAHHEAIRLDERLPGWAGDMANQIASLIERRETEQVLREREEWFIQLTDNIHAAFWIFEPQTPRIIYVSPVYEDIWGRTCASLYERPGSFMESIHPDDRECVSAAWARMVDEPYDQEYRVVRPDGMIRWVWSRASAIHNDPGASYRIVGVSEDITERKQAEEERDRFFTLSLDMLCIAGMDGYFKRLNPAWEQTFGFTTAELLAEPFLNFIHPDDRDATVAVARQLASGGVDLTSFENRFRCKDGTYKSLEWTGASFPDQQLIYAVARDVTERKRLEAQFLQAQKMESVGRLAGGVAHDFNNLLTAISGYTDLALGGLPSNDIVRTDLLEIQKATGRATDLTRQLLAFARKQIIEPHVLNLNNLIGDLDKLLRRLIGEDIELITLPAPDLGQVRADPGQIEQLLVNLVVNARDAMPNGGKLTIETRNVFLNQQNAQQHIAVATGPYVLLAVSDTGIGMDEDVQRHIFEPFFTTKAPGKGTGLGLATCYGIVKQHGGYIWLYSEISQGTTFKVYLPRVEDAADEAQQRADALELPRGTETVLLVEDEAMVRDLAARVLEGQGYTVLTATNGEEALSLGDRYQGAIDLLLTDMVMPQMSGNVLAERFTALRPGARMLFMSGYADNAIIHHSRISLNSAFLQKPFSPIELANKVRDVLDR